MKIEMRLGLAQQETLDDLKRLPKIEREVSDISFQYRLCPANRLKEISQHETQLGTFHEREIYVSRGLHYASIPVVGFLFHLKTRNTEELTKIFGEQINQLKPVQREEFIARVALEDFGADVLREEELADLLEKFREEKQFDLSTRESVVSAIVQRKADRLTSSNMALPALTKQITIQDEHYRRELQAYNTNIQKNRFTRKSQAYQRLIQKHPGLKKTLSPFMVQSEPIAETIINHPVYGANLHSVVAFLDQLTTALNSKTEVQIENEATGLIYLIESHFRDHLEKKPPFQFKDTKPDEVNIVIKGRYMEKFTRGLRTRLVSQLFAEIDKAEQTLAALPKLSAKIQTSQELSQVVKAHLKLLLPASAVPDRVQDNFMIVPMTEISAIVEKQLEDYLTILLQTATQTPQNYQELLSLVHARELLQKAHVSTDTLDQEIKARLSDQNQQLQDRLGPRRLAR